MILENQLKDEKLLSTILDLFKNREKLSQMGIKSKEIGNSFAAKKIVDEVEMYIK